MPWSSIAVVKPGVLPRPRKEGANGVAHGRRRGYLSLKSESLKGSRKMIDQERWLNEVLDILGLPRDTAYRDHARELVEQGASLEQIYGTLQMRMNSKRS